MVKQELLIQRVKRVQLLKTRISKDFKDRHLYRNVESPENEFSLHSLQFQYSYSLIILNIIRIRRLQISITKLQKDLEDANNI